MKRLYLLLATILVVGITSTPAITLEYFLSHQWSREDFRHKVAKYFADEVINADVGLQVKIYPHQSIFKSHEQYLPLSRGQLDLAIIPLYVAKDIHAAFNLAQMPGLIKSYEHAAKLYNSEFMQAFESLLAEDDIKILAHGFVAGGIAGKDKCITKPEDVTGLQVQAVGSPIEQMMEAAGASIVPLKWAEVYGAMKQGKVEAANNLSPSMVSYRIFDQASCYTRAQNFSPWYSYQPLLMNKSKYDSLTDLQKTALNMAAEKTEEYYMEMAKEADENATKYFTDAHVEVVSVTEEEFIQWQDIAKRTSYETFYAEVPNGRELIEMALSN